MPDLDVSDILDDPDFSDDSLVCIRFRETVDKHGRARLDAEKIHFSGVVTQARDNTLVRLPQGSQPATNSILVITRFGLNMATDGFTADVVQYNNRTYTVIAIADYFRYGNGFIEATCEMTPVNGEYQRDIQQ